MELPALTLRVIEHRLMRSVRACGAAELGVWLQGVVSPVRYGVSGKAPHHPAGVRARTKRRQGLERLAKEMIELLVQALREVDARWQELLQSGQQMHPPDSERAPAKTSAPEGGTSSSPGRPI
ncbi:MAG TPA: hypothetical protein PKD73_13220 [Burkholderiaceae bacterium]|nr:hypothetical protein [Burkholderiaceae bacterium]